MTVCGTTGMAHVRVYQPVGSAEDNCLKDRKVCCLPQLADTPALHLSHITVSNTICHNYSNYPHSTKCKTPFLPVTEWEDRITRSSISHFNNVPVRGDKPSRCIASQLNQNFLLHVEHLVTFSGSKIGCSLHNQCYKNDVAMTESHWYSDSNLCQCLCVKHKFHIDYLGIESTSPRWEASDHGPRERYRTAPLEGLNNEQCPLSVWPSWLKKIREERIPTRCNNIEDLLSISDVDYWLQSRHVSGIFMPIIRRKDHVLPHMEYICW